MYQNKKFENAARRRRFYAALLTLALHAMLFAAVSRDDSFLDEVIPDFVKELFQDDINPGKKVPQA